MGRSSRIGSLRHLAEQVSVRVSQLFLLVAMGAAAALVAFLYFELFG